MTIKFKIRIHSCLGWNVTTVFKEVFPFSKNKLFEKANHHIHLKAKRNILLVLG